MRRPRTLRSRLFFGFVGAILLAILTTVLVAGSTRPEAITGAEAMAHNVSTRLASEWEDPEAARAYVAEVHDVTGFDVRLVRDPHRLPPRVHAAARHGASIVPENPQHIFVPVVRDGQLAGALEMEKFGPRPTALQWWRFALGLVLVGAALSVMAGRIANLLARPLEQLANAADRFGSGDLGFRADAGRARRWVALEVHEVAVAFNRMADRVEAMVRGQRELLGAISHELRSPLGRARVALEIARDRLPEDAGERSPRGPLDDVEKQLGAVDGILGELLDVTRAGLADLRKERRPRGVVARAHRRGPTASDRRARSGGRSRGRRARVRRGLARTRVPQPARQRPRARASARRARQRCAWLSSTAIASASSCATVDPASAPVSPRKRSSHSCAATWPALAPAKAPATGWGSRS